MFDNLTSVFKEESQELQIATDGMISKLEESKESDASAMKDAILLAKKPEITFVETFETGVNNVEGNLNENIEELNDNGQFMKELTTSIENDHRIYLAEQRQIMDITRNYKRFDEFDIDIRDIKAEFDKHNQNVNIKVMKFEENPSYATEPNIVLLRFHIQGLRTAFDRYTETLNDYEKLIQAMNEKIITIQSKRTARDVNDPSSELSGVETELKTLKDKLISVSITITSRYIESN